jgi:hypothetical protein
MIGLTAPHLCGLRPQRHGCRDAPTIHDACPSNPVTMLVMGGDGGAGGSRGAGGGDDVPPAAMTGTFTTSATCHVKQRQGHAMHDWCCGSVWVCVYVFVCVYVCVCGVGGLR